MSKLLQFYRATVYASALYAVIVRLYVCPSVRPSQAGIVSKLQDDSNWVLEWRLPHTYRTLYYKDIRIPIKGHSSLWWNFIQKSGL